MKRRRPPRGLPLFAAIVAFGAGALVDGLLRTYGPPQPAGPVDAPTLISSAPPKPAPVPTDAAAAPPGPSGVPAPPSEPRVAAAPAATTGSTSIRLPIDGMRVDGLQGGFNEKRGDRRHEAVDILAPRSTPIHAVQDGTIAKLFVSRQGGNTIYQYDPSGRLCYYYAHLERYAAGLKDGDAVVQGQVIGYVGTTGNAPPNTPHLHFAIFQLGEDRRWWKGEAIDPYPILKATS
jgi:peptidoglycan LD-endopeptidase LytH